MVSSHLRLGNKRAIGYPAQEGGTHGTQHAEQHVARVRIVHPHCGYHHPRKQLTAHTDVWTLHDVHIRIVKEVHSTSLLNNNDINIYEVNP